MRNRLFGIVLVLVGACSGGHKGLTYRAACQSIGDATCARQAQCSPPAMQNCAQQFVQTCCAGFPNCDQEIADQGAQAALDKCLSDLKTVSCADLEAGNYPASCQ
ncbi:MAG TPA: hypothetical protein VKE22_00395 [Haliangiales bacterium]|nr:hypothetical protein [Haliangiales bacterium]